MIIKKKLHEHNWFQGLPLRTRFPKSKLYESAITPILLGLIVIGFLYIAKILTSSRGIVESFGIPYVKPFLIFGSPPFLFHRFVVSEYYLKHIAESLKKGYFTWIF